MIDGGHQDGGTASRLETLHAKVSAGNLKQNRSEAVKPLTRLKAKTCHCWYLV